MGAHEGNIGLTSEIFEESGKINSALQEARRRNENPNKTIWTDLRSRGEQHANAPVGQQQGNVAPEEQSQMPASSIDEARKAPAEMQDLSKSFRAAKAESARAASEEEARQASEDAERANNRAAWSEIDTNALAARLAWDNIAESLTSGRMLPAPADDNQFKDSGIWSSSEDYDRDLNASLEFQRVKATPEWKAATDGLSPEAAARLEKSYYDSLKNDSEQQRKTSSREWLEKEANRQSNIDRSIRQEKRSTVLRFTDPGTFISEEDADRIMADHNNWDDLPTEDLLNLFNNFPRSKKPEFWNLIKKYRDDIVLDFSERPVNYYTNDDGMSTISRENKPQANDHLLPGSILKRLYQVPKNILSGKGRSKEGKKYSKMSEDEKILEAMKQQRSSLIEGATDISRQEKADGEPKSFMEIRDWELEENVRRQREWIDLAWIPIESQHIDKDGYIVYEDTTEEYIEWYMQQMHLYPEERWLVFHQLSKYLGYSPDTKDRFLNQETNKIPDNIIRDALKDMWLSQRRYGHPYHMMSNTKYGGTQCFPLGIMSREEAEILTRSGGILEGQDPLDVISKARDDFVSFTQPAMYKAAQTEENGMAQLYVLLDYVRALCSETTVSPRKYNVSESREKGYMYLIDECDPDINPGIDPEVGEARRNQLMREAAIRDRSSTKFDRVRNRTRYYYSEDVYDDDGKLVHRKGDRVNQKDYVNGSMEAPIRCSRLQPLDAVCTFTTNMMKLMGVLGFTPVIVSGVVENAVGNVYTMESNKLFSFLSDQWGKKFNSGFSSETYAPTKGMYAYMMTDEAAEGIKAMKALEMAGGMDALILFRQSYSRLTVENVKKFLAEDINKPSLLNGPFATKVKAMAAKANDVMQFLVPGDIGFERIQAKRWMQSLMINMMGTAYNGDSLEHSFTASEVQGMIEADGVASFMASMCETVAGRDAFLMMRNQTMSRESPLTHAVDVALRKSGLTNVFVTSQIDTYFKFGVNLVQLFVPFSNTFNYLGVKLANQIATNGILDTDKLDLSILDYQIGGHDMFFRGLAKNLIYDFVKIGNVAIFGCFVYLVFMAIGFDEPEEESLKYNFEEYRIGRKIGLGPKDANGNATGIPIYRAWWLDDLVGMGLPIAYALGAYSLQEQKRGDYDPDLAWKIFHGACWDIVSGASFFDLARSMQNAGSIISGYDAMMSDAEENPMTNENLFSYTWMTLFELPLARMFGKMVTPAFIRDYYKDAYDHTPYYVYNRESSTPGKTQKVTDWIELQKRIESRYNPAYGHFNNLMENGYWRDNGTSMKTGFLMTEMPLATAGDDLVMTFMKELDFDEDEVPNKATDPAEYEDYMEKKCEFLISKIEEYGDPEIAVQNGFIIPYQLRIEFAKYCSRRINVARNNQAELGYVESRNQQDYYWNLLTEWARNDDIPWSDAGYVKLRTDSEPVYYWKNTLKPAWVGDYYSNPGLVEKVYVPKGNTPNDLMPLTTPETANTGYNFETKSYWQGEYTDLDKIFEDAVNSGVLVPYGRDKGVPLANAIFGGTPTFSSDEMGEAGAPMSEEFGAKDVSTMGRRGYVHFDESMLLDLRNYNPDVANKKAIDAIRTITPDNVDGGLLGEDGEKPKDNSGGSSSTRPYGYSGGGGGGGYSYNPRIYSNPRSVYANRPATMYSKQPGSARTTYLNPSFSTKGSREAYKRQDL